MHQPSLLFAIVVIHGGGAPFAFCQSARTPSSETRADERTVTVSPWVSAPSVKVQQATPDLVHETFYSELMKVSVGYSVVLPPGYASSQRRYPVVYWLHGGGGNECSSLFTANAWRRTQEDAADVKALDDVILVYPNAGRSGYMDHYDRKVLLESLIVQELIPRIDSRFRTIDRRDARAVHGFSMGASGALKFVIKYPELFWLIRRKCARGLMSPRVGRMDEKVWTCDSSREVSEVFL